MQHAGNGKILNVSETSSRLCRHVGTEDWFSNYRVLGRIFQRSFRVHLEHKLLSTDQLAQTGAWLLGTKLVDRLPGSRRSLSQVGTAAWDSRAAAGATVIGRDCRVAFDDCDFFDGNAEFFGNHLADCDAKAGTHVDLAGVNGNRTIRMDRDEAVDLLRINGLAGRGERSPFLRNTKLAQREVHNKTDDHRAGCL